MAVGARKEIPEHGHLGVTLSPFGLSLRSPFIFRQARGERTSNTIRPVSWLAVQNTGIYVHLGNLLMERGEFALSLQQFKDVLHLKPDYVEARYNLGNVLLRMGRPDEAVTHFEEALRQGYLEAYNNFGMALVKLGRIEYAVACYRKVLRIEPGHALARLQLERLL